MKNKIEKIGLLLFIFGWVAFFSNHSPDNNLVYLILGGFGASMFVLGGDE
jgi:hypothetical protein